QRQQHSTVHHQLLRQGRLASEPLWEKIKIGEISAVNCFLRIFPKFTRMKTPLPLKAWTVMQLLLASGAAASAELWRVRLQNHEICRSGIRKGDFDDLEA